MLVENHTVDPDLLNVLHFVQVGVVQIGAFLRIEEAVGDTEKAAVLDHFFFRNVAVRPLMKIQ